MRPEGEGMDEAARPGSAAPGSAAIVRTEARDLDYDRYLAALLSPADARADLLTLAAFHGEIARIAFTVREPAIGEIRLQWWRDALEAFAPAFDTGAPLADAVRAMTLRAGLPVADLVAIIDAYSGLLYPGALADAAAVSDFADAAQGAAFRLAALRLAQTTSPRSGDEVAAGEALITAAGQAYGRVQLLRALPALCALGRSPFGDGAVAGWQPAVQPVMAEAREWLAKARNASRTAPAYVLTAVLPVALVEPYLAALEKLGAEVASREAAILPLSRVWRIFWARKRGRL